MGANTETKIRKQNVKNIISSLYYTKVKHPDMDIKATFLGLVLGDKSIITNTSNARQSIIDVTTIDYARCLLTATAADSLAKTGTKQRLDSYGIDIINIHAPDRFDKIEADLVEVYKVLSNFNNEYSNVYYDRKNSLNEADRICTGSAIKSAFDVFCQENDYTQVMDSLNKFATLYFKQENYGFEYSDEEYQKLNDPEIQSFLDSSTAIIYETCTKLTPDQKTK